MQIATAIPENLRAKAAARLRSSAGIHVERAQANFKLHRIDSAGAELRTARQRLSIANYLVPPPTLH